jgi:hypothetical protein
MPWSEITAFRERDRSLVETRSRWRTTGRRASEMLAGVQRLKDVSADGMRCLGNDRKGACASVEVDGFPQDHHHWNGA